MSDYLRHPRHGPLPALLLLLTVATGVVDAVSLLSLDRVFVANMTGNVVFVGLALAGSPGFSVAGSLVALAAFAAGAGLGGMVIAGRGSDRARLLAGATALETVLLAGATAVWWRWDAGAVLVVTALTACALGLQNAAVRRIAVPDLTTTVLTMTITGIAADLRQGDRRTALRRALAVAAMLLGALLGAVIVLGPGPTPALIGSVAVVAAVCALSTYAARRRLVAT